MRGNLSAALKMGPFRTAVRTGAALLFCGLAHSATADRPSLISASPIDQKTFSTSLLGCELEFRGFVQERGIYQFSLFNQSTGGSSWVALGREAFGFVVSSFDPQNEIISVLRQGHRYELQMKRARISATNPAHDAAAAMSALMRELSAEISAFKRQVGRNPGPFPLTMDRKDNRPDDDDGDSLRAHIRRVLRINFAADPDLAQIMTSPEMLAEISRYHGDSVSMTGTPAADN